MKPTSAAFGRLTRLSTVLVVDAADEVYETMLASLEMPQSLEREILAGLREFGIWTDPALFVTIPDWTL